MTDQQVDELVQRLVRQQAEGAALSRSLDDQANELMVHFRQAVVDLCRSMVPDPGLAEDCAHEALRAAWERLRQYRGPGTFRAWLYTIARNQCRLQLGRRARPLVALLDEDGWFEPGGPLPGSTPSPSPLSQVLRQERQAFCEYLTRDLPAVEAQVFCLRYEDGLSRDDIRVLFERAGQPLDRDVRIVLERLKRRLRRRVQQGLEDGSITPSLFFTDPCA